MRCSPSPSHCTMNLHRTTYAIAVMIIWSLLTPTTVVGATSSSAGSGDGPLCVTTAAPGLDACVTPGPVEQLRSNETTFFAGRSSVLTSLAQGRGKKKKAKNTMMNVMVGGTFMTAIVVIFMFVNTITATLGKAILFIFITKFLVITNWSSPSPKKSEGALTVVVNTHSSGGGSKEKDKKSHTGNLNLGTMYRRP